MVVVKSVVGARSTSLARLPLSFRKSRSKIAESGRDFGSSPPFAVGGGISQEALSHPSDETVGTHIQCVLHVEDRDRRCSIAFQSDLG